MVIVGKIKNAHEEYMRMQKKGSMAPTRRVAQGWKAPSPGTIKVNCDASWCRQTKTGGIRVVPRESEGHLIGGANRKRNGGTIEELKVEAILLGTNLAIEKEWERGDRVGLRGGD